MSPRDQVAISAAAVRWHLARKRRLAIGPKARQAEQAANAIPWFANRSASGQAFVQFLNTSDDFAAAKRKERLALRELSKLCEKVGADAGEVFEVDAKPHMLEVVE